MPLYQPNQTILNGKYKVEKQLGAGAFGEVYLVTHLDLGVHRAVKVAHRDMPGFGSTLFEEAFDRFRQEAQIGARLKHDNLIQVFDFYDGEESLHLVMEYAAGGSLQDKIQQAKQSNKLFSINYALQIMLDVASGLVVLHSQSNPIVHRDLKPSNILFDAEGKAKIADLGLAQVPGGLSQRSRLGSVAQPHPGTPAYMSPEQESGFAMLKPSSDIYSVGVIFFEILSGINIKLAKPGTNLSKYRNDIPQEIFNLMERMLLKDLEKRVWNGNDLLEEVNDIKNKCSLNINISQNNKNIPINNQPSVFPQKTVLEAQVTQPNGTPDKVNTPSAGSDKKQNANKANASTITKNTIQEKPDEIPLNKKKAKKKMILFFGFFVVLWILICFGAYFFLRNSNLFQSEIPPSQNFTFTIEPTKTKTPTPKPTQTKTPMPLSIKVEQIYEFAQPTDLQLVLDFSPDGELLASSGWDKIIRIWNVKTGEMVNEFPALVSKYVSALAFSPDGQVLVSGGADEGRITLWDVDSGSELGFMDGHTSEITSLEFSPDGRFLASGSCCSGSAENSVRIWDFTSLTELRIIDNRDEPILDISYSYNGEIIAVLSRDGLLKFWNTQDWTEKISISTVPMGTILFSDNGKSFFGAGWDNNIWVWDMPNVVNPKKLAGHTDWVQDISLNYNERLLASSGGFDLSLRIWDIHSKIEIWNLSFEEEVFSVTNVEFSPTSNYLAVCVGPKVIVYEIID